MPPVFPVTQKIDDFEERDMDDDAKVPQGPKPRSAAENELIDKFLNQMSTKSKIKPTVLRSSE